MKKTLVLSFLLFILVGCNAHNGELTFSEVNPEKANANVKDFIDTVELNEDGDGNGIYVFDSGEDHYYVFLSQEYLINGNSFGEVDVKVEDRSLNIYLRDRSKQEANGTKQKLYEIRAKGDYEFLRVFKNGEETTIEAVGG